MQQYDIAIVGAGPSGCACALALQGTGLRVVLIDKENFPRDKTCGDAIPGPAFKAMDHIHPQWGQAMRAFADKAAVRSSRVFAPNGKTLTLDWITYSYNSKRLDFDNFLYQLVCSETTTEMVHQRLQQVSVEKDGVLCSFQDGTSLKATIIIGCDGANSIVRRQLGQSADWEKPGASAVRAYFKSVAGIKAGVNEFHFFKEFPGYFWIFPLADDWVNVGFGISKKNKSKTPINLRDSLQKIIATSPAIAPRFENAQTMDHTKGFALTTWDKKRTISGNRYLLCGDAASLIDPLQGHGIDKAMWSGLLAAQRAIHCFKSNNFSAEHLSQYDREIYQKMGSELLRSRRITQAVIQFPCLINVGVWIGQQQKLTQWIAMKLKI